MAEDNNSKGSNYSKRRFRRYERAVERRRKNDRADARFVRLMGVITVLAVSMAIGLALIGYMTAVGYRGVKFDPIRAAHWSEPWLGPLSRLEAFSMGLIGLVLLYFFWRSRRRRK